MLHTHTHKIINEILAIPPSSQVASLIGVLFVFGTCLSVFSHFWQYPEWVGPLVMLALILILFILPLPLLKYKSRIWLGKEMVCAYCINVVISVTVLAFSLFLELSVCPWHEISLLSQLPHLYSHTHPHTFTYPPPTHTHTRSHSSPHAGSYISRSFLPCYLSRFLDR